MTPAQCRAARAWLNLSQNDLASEAKVSNSTVRDFEAGRRSPIPTTLLAMEAVFRRLGLHFLPSDPTGSGAAMYYQHERDRRLEAEAGDDPPLVARINKVMKAHTAEESD